MGNNQLKLSGGLRLGNANADLSTPSAGLVYFNSTSSTLRLYDGSSWVSLAGSSNEFGDNVFRIFDDVDATKKLAFSVGGITTGTVRTLTMPDANVDLGNLTNSNISASAAIAYSKLNLTGSIVNADVGASAAIAYSKLNLSGSIVNADVSASAAIAYSKLALTNSIVNADISASAAIAFSKLASLTSGHILVGNVSNVATSVTMSGDATIVASGAITVANNAISDAKFRQSAALSVVGRSANSTGNVADISAGTDHFVLRRSGTSLAFGLLTNNNIDAAAAIAYSKLTLTNSIVNADVSASAAIAYSKLALSNSIVNADISASAAIAYSKLNLATSIVNNDIATAAAIARTKLANGTANRLVVNGAGGAMADAAAITAARALISDANGIPTHSSVTSTELGHVSGVTSAIQTQLNAKANDADVIKKDGSVAFTADQPMGGFKLTNLGTPTASTDAANKQYVDNVAQGLKPKQAVRVASTANITTLSGLLTIDGVTLVANDRVLVKDQSSQPNNGIYVAAAGAWSRATDFDSLTPIDEINGAYVAVQQGTENAGKIYVQQGTVTSLGVSNIVFVFFNSSSSLVGGDGITVSGNNISVDHDGEGLQFVSTQLALELDGSTLSKSASGLKVASGGITNTEVSASAAIAYSKLALTGNIVNADVSASAAIAYSKLSLANSIVNNDIASAAAIAYSKLNLTGSILNADISASAAIAYSKLALTGSIVNADVSASAAIGLSKLATVTANRALVSDGSGVISASSVTNTELGHLAGVTSAIQTQLDGKVTGPASSTDEALVRFDGTTGKLVQSTTSATLSDSGSLAVADVFRRGDGNLSNVVEEEYIHSGSLTASTTAVLASLTYDSRTYKGIRIEYVARNGNAVRSGKLILANNNALTVASNDVSIFDSSTETADINLSWSAAINGNNVEISYTSGAGTYNVSLDVKRLRV